MTNLQFCVGVVKYKIIILELTKYVKELAELITNLFPEKKSNNFLFSSVLVFKRNQ